MNKGLINGGHVSSKAALAIWLVLIVASLGTTWIGDHQDAFVTWGVLTVILVSAIKARLVIRNYMDVKSASWVLKAAYDAWLALTTAGILFVLYCL